MSQHENKPVKQNNSCQKQSDPVKSYPRVEWAACYHTLRDLGTAGRNFSKGVWLIRKCFVLMRIKELLNCEIIGDLSLVIFGN